VAIAFYKTSFAVRFDNGFISEVLTNLFYFNELIMHKTAIYYNAGLGQSWSCLSHFNENRPVDFRLTDTL